MMYRALWTHDPLLRRAALLAGLLCASCASVDIGELYQDRAEEAGEDAGGGAADSGAASGDVGGGADDGAGDSDAAALGCASPIEVWPDHDGDGFGDKRAPVTRTCGTLAGHVTNNNDCNDLSPVTHPNAADTPGDGVDQDCDGSEQCFVDADGDGARGMDGAQVLSEDGDCEDPGEELITAPATDCDDGDPARYGGAAEVCDGVDNDCDGQIDGEGICPCPATRYGDHVYLLCDQRRSWEDALSFCLAQGMSLATISSGDESGFVNDLVEAGRVPDTWIGFNDRAVEGSFLWVNGEGNVFTGWDSGEPNDGNGDEDCALVMTSRGTGPARARAWDDRPCSRADYAFLCESMD